MPPRVSRVDSLEACSARVHAQPLRLRNRRHVPNPVPQLQARREVIGEPLELDRRPPFPPPLYRPRTPALDHSFDSLAQTLPLRHTLLLRLVPVALPHDMPAPERLDRHDARAVDVDEAQLLADPQRDSRRVAAPRALEARRHADAEREHQRGPPRPHPLAPLVPVEKRLEHGRCAHRARGARHGQLRHLGRRRAPPPVATRDPLQLGGGQRLPSVPERSPPKVSTRDLLEVDGGALALHAVHQIAHDARPVPPPDPPGGGAALLFQEALPRRAPPRQALDTRRGHVPVFYVPARQVAAVRGLQAEPCREAHPLSVLPRLPGTCDAAVSPLDLQRGVVLAVLLRHGMFELVDE
mmetsp:Transcript_38637/g.88088  ORF Transcript_38637/g.88088 Transcript_38637/m.88088 type:complete len:353 (-) Transcript_38637:520-1578(-)